MAWRLQLHLRCRMVYRLLKIIVDSAVSDGDLRDVKADEDEDISDTLVGL